MAPTTDRTETRLSMPMALVLGAAFLAVVAGFLLAASGGDGLGLILAAAAGFAAATMWLAGCIAMGVRVGLSSD